METIPVQPPLASSPRKLTTKVSLIVMHSTAGSGLSGSIETLRKKGLGYNYLIERNGKVHKGCAASRRTAHAGSSYGPVEQTKGISRAQFKNTKPNRKAGRVAKFKAGTSVNEYSIGISFCNLNDGKEAITPAQLDAAAELIGELKNQFPDISTLSAHFEVSKGRKSDPKLFNLDDFAARVGLAPWRLPMPQVWVES